MKSRTTIAKLLAALTLATFFSIHTLNAADAAPRIQRTGMFGLARGQVARINVVNVSDNSIQVQMAFLDATGRVVGRDAKTISPGQAVFFDVVFDSAAGELNRASVRALVATPPDPNRGSTPPDPCRVSVEVFDGDTGRTAILPEVQ